MNTYDNYFVLFVFFFSMFDARFSVKKKNRALETVMLQ